MWQVGKGMVRGPGGLGRPSQDGAAPEPPIQAPMQATIQQPAQVCARMPAWLAEGRLDMLNALMRCLQLEAVCWIHTLYIKRWLAWLNCTEPPGSGAPRLGKMATLFTIPPPHTLRSMYAHKCGRAGDAIARAPRHMVASLHAIVGSLQTCS